MSQQNLNSSNAPIIESFPIPYDPNRDAGLCRYDPAAAERVCKFIETYCCHVEGSLAGEPYILPPWQRAIVQNLFGWLRPDGRRRYREAMVYVPKKNSKSSLFATVGLYCLTSDGEAGAQVYSIAAEKEQAGLIFRIMRAMVERSTELSANLNPLPSFKCIEYSKTNSIYKALSAESYSKNGLNVSCCLSDEVCCQKDKELINNMQTAMKTRRNPLMLHISTADVANPESPCNQILDYAKKVRDKVIDDNSFLPGLWYATKEDDWKDEKLWAKVNPNFGLSVDAESFKLDCKKAQNEPSYLNDFLRYGLNITTDSKSVWIPLDKYDACVSDFDPEELKGAHCSGGLDLSATTDLTAFSLHFTSGHVLSWAWIPEDRARIKQERDRVSYSLWRDQGFLEMTPGDVIDYEFIRAKINSLAKIYKIDSIGFDPFNATDLVQRMTEMDRLPMVEFRQGYMSMNAPSKSFEAAILGKKVTFPTNPVMRWNVSNTMVESDPAGNIKPSKKASTARIDMVVSAIMALGLSNAGNAGKFAQSIYERRGALFI